MSAPPEVITFGCRLNAYESEVMRKNAVVAGLTDAIIINTCAVTAEAERQARQSIRKLKRQRPEARIIVTGCASQITPESFVAMTEVDWVIGNDRKLDRTIFDSVIPAKAGIQRRALSEPNGSSPAQTRGQESDVRRNVSHGSIQRAFVQVQNGCDHRCTFCIIPYGRGPSRSLPIGGIADETRKRVAEGYNEIVFTGVDIASYGGDLPGQPKLGQMIRRVLALVPELKRLRLSSVDPAAMDNDLWRLIAEEPRLMPHLHLSLQAGDDMVLKRMKRRHSREDVIALCDRARQLRPEIAFGADVIAGFPTESDAMFENTYELIKQCGFTWLHVFPYSARKGTPATKMPQVHGSLRKVRAERLRALASCAARKHFDDLIGKHVEVLVEQQGLGCTPQFAKIKLEGDAPVGRLVMAKCTAREIARVI